MTLNLSDVERVTVLFSVLTERANTDAVRGLRIRLRQMGEHSRDELLQFRHLQRACREDPELENALENRGIGKPTRFDPTVPDPEMGVLVQSFNRMIDTHWRGSSEPIHETRARRPRLHPYTMVVKINAARNLKIGDLRSSDPYCKLIYQSPSIPAMAQRHRSGTQSSTLDPIWAEERKFSGVTYEGTLRIEVWDEDRLGDDDPLGWVEIAMSDINFEEGSDAWLPLCDVETGEIHIGLKLLP